ncbi:MAG: hypothetical protein ACYDAL_00240 [Candidatus Dormibacteraceae bacterium]
MPIALIAGPAVALIGIVAVFFVLRRKSVDKRSMYSARRSQIEHKVRAARQRTLTGRAEKPAETTVAPTQGTPFANPQVPVATYEPSAFEPPPAAIPPMGSAVQEAPSASPWDVGPAAPLQRPFEAPAAPPPYEAAPTEEVWVPAPAPPVAPPELVTPLEPVTPAEPVRPAMAPATPAAWSVVGEAKQPAVPSEPEPRKKKGKHQDEEPAGSWQLASGNAPGVEGVEPEDVIKAPSQGVAIAQYAVLVVGLVAVLIGVLIMVAGSPVK